MNTLKEMDLFTAHGSLQRPVIFFRGKIASFEKAENGPHLFGGALPKAEGGSPKAAFQTVLTVSTQHCPVLSSCDIEKIPFVFAFHHSTALRYTINKDASLVFNPVQSYQGKDFPYPDYPEVFPTTNFKSTQWTEMSWKEFGRLLVQDFEGAGLDAQEDPTMATLIVPPRQQDYGVSLWGSLGKCPPPEKIEDTAPQCVFLFKLDTQSVIAFNLCT